MFQEAALVAHELRLDPVTVLEERNTGRRAARLGATLYLLRERKKQQDEAAQARQKPLV